MKPENQLTWPQAIDGALDDLQSILLSVLIKLGPFAVALMPALFTAYAIYYTFESEAGPGLALCFAIVVGLAFETVGIVATHTAIDLYNGWAEGRIQAFKAWLMALLVPFYVVGVAGAVWYSEGAFEPLVQALGIASPFLTVIVYIAVALARDLSKVEQKTLAEQGAEQKGKQEERAFERELKRERLQMEHELRLKELELKAQQPIQANSIAYTESKAKPEISTSEFQCPNCIKSFATIQALSAHGRFCKSIIRPLEEVEGTYGRNGNHRKAG